GLRVPAEISTRAENRPALRRGVIRNIRKLTSDVVHFDLHLSDPMDFEAGQFVVLETDELSGGRAYSMVNFDRAAARIAFVLKRKPSGGFFGWLFFRGKVDLPVAGCCSVCRSIFLPGEGKNNVSTAAPFRPARL